MELMITTRNYKAFALRGSPSNRVSHYIRSKTYGNTEKRAIKTAEVVGDMIEAIMSRGYLTKYELTRTFLPDVLGFAEMPPIKKWDKRDQLVFKRVLILKGIKQ